ncbi:glutamine--fructose-6-phosphate transaminase (isomerizing) [Agromyces sp. LHK192]|uniref:glutamine--fructose-6-phosphate transaminase (isomerizing) n=1 Tax=Agromyces sp. LHK192 TaxID=2498704 RepID=UPI000FDA8266|nr:glutamine--fructose-6-phosphate transaminase (isomerizing) [Agromyces sp. LHK192]
MCGIIACRTESDAVGRLVAGLGVLEYRGYDSAGVAVLAADGSTAVFRTTKRVAALRGLVDAWEGPALGGVGIGHTRWATHGGVSVTNAHPHQDCARRISIVHNGIIENAEELAGALAARGHVFESEVDSEIIAHLVEEAVARGKDVRDALAAATACLHGSWAIVAMDARTGRLAAAAHRSPLLVGASDEGVCLASDASAFATWVDGFRVVGEHEVVAVGADVEWTTAGRPSRPPDLRPVVAYASRPLLGAHDRHMDLEIADQPAAAERAVGSVVDGIADGSLWRSLDLPRFDRVRVVACGTSLNAGEVIGGVVSGLGGGGFQSVVASEAAGAFVEPRTLTLAISQSGETADVLRAIDEGPADSPVLALVNNPDSTLARTVDAAVPCLAGPEVGVAATKTFVCQVLVGSAVMLSAMVDAGRLDRATARRLADELRHVPGRLARAADAAHVEDVVGEVRSAPGFLFLGRGAAVPYAAEGALKLKELSYRWAEAYPAGELKHGPLALVEAGTPVVVVDDGDVRLPSNIAEVRARGGRVITVGRIGSRIEAPVDVRLPWGPLEAVVPLQRLALGLAGALGLDADKPRNLAKSVTVD